MAATIAVNNSGPASQRLTGSLSGTYTAATEAQSHAQPTYAIAAGVLTITPGFIPRKVSFWNETARIDCFWRTGFAASNFRKQIANGTNTLETGGALVVNASTGVVTFTLSGIVTDNETLTWEIVG